MPDTGCQLTAFGELFVELFPIGDSSAYEPVCGGGAARVARIASRFGCPAALYGKTGKDSMGSFLRQSLSADRVDLRNLATADGIPTGMAVIRKDGDSCIREFYRDCADIQCRTEDFDLHQIEGKCFYFTSSLLAQKPSRDICLSLARYAKNHGAVTVFSPTLRPDLWKMKGEIRKLCRKALELSGIVKMTAEELTFLMEIPDSDQAAARLMLRYHPKILLVTLGREGCFFRSVYGDMRLPGFPSEETPDREAAEDVFMGAFLSRFLSGGKTLADCGIGDIAAYVLFANGAASLAGSGKDLPTLAQAEEFVLKSLM